MQGRGQETMPTRLWRICFIILCIVALVSSFIAFWQGLIMWVFPLWAYFYGDYLQAEYRGTEVKG